MKWTQPLPTRTEAFTLKLLGILCALFVSACTNSLLSNLSRNVMSASPLTTPSSSPTSTPIAVSLDQYVISSASVASGSTSGSAPSFALFFDTVKSTTPVTTHCNTSSSGLTPKPCFCQFSWSEINASSGASLAIQRNVQTSLTQVQPALVICSAPSVYSSEIIDGTQIKVSLVAGSANPDLGTFSVKPYLYTKSAKSVSGSFQDQKGNIFDNIVHYSCYNKFKKGLAIQSKRYIQSNSNTGDQQAILYGSAFCLLKSGAAASISESCPNLGEANFSSQAYYFNLYIRNSEKGDINQFNDGYVCPLVQEPLEAPIGSSVVGTSNQFWPGDKTFALALSPSADFSVGVQANTKLSGGLGDPTAGNSQCFPTASSNGGNSSANTNSVVSSCLGFAAPVSSDGSCPYIKGSSGQIIQTFRLRRFVALYPRVFDTGGKPMSHRQAIDTIYVLDRPVASSSGTTNPLKPYTMLGPKPCPFAFFDRNDVTYDTTTATTSSQSMPLGYRATNDTRWITGDGKANNEGTNIDGIEFPNEDSETSCSATLPFLSSDKTRFFMTTVNKKMATTRFKHLFIRPFQPFTPHYEEDTDFRACAPQAKPFVDPPLHFATSSSGSNHAWCAESYPTQNTNIASLDPPLTPSANPITPLGLVSPYTSHLSKRNGNTPGVLTACTATALSIPTTNYSYPSAAANQPIAYARHSNLTPYPKSNSTTNASTTCDRTVAMTNEAGWTHFPLLAPEADVERGIRADSSYNCTITYDNQAGKAALGKTPQEGCCVIDQSGTPLSIVGDSHLEPSQGTCLPPSY
ncbi:MAG: hypothetical protein ACO3A2_05955 [Bdellovibrionia bacterium]